jgi:hypothetical protein
MAVIMMRDIARDKSGADLGEYEYPFFTETLESAVEYFKAHPDECSEYKPNGPDGKPDKSADSIVRSPVEHVLWLVNRQAKVDGSNRKRSQAKSGGMGIRDLVKALKSHDPAKARAAVAAMRETAAAMGITLAAVGAESEEEESEEESEESGS